MFIVHHKGTFSEIKCATFHKGEVSGRSDLGRLMCVTDPAYRACHLTLSSVHLLVFFIQHEKIRIVDK